MLSDSQVSAVESMAWFHVDHSPTMLLDTQLRIRAVNKAYERITGHTRAELVGAALFDIFRTPPRTLRTTEPPPSPRRSRPSCGAASGMWWVSSATIFPIRLTPALSGIASGHP
ncbi:hypothetical protein MTOK_50300 [Mycolicibacterium tokaiense]|nr:hypothetical protein MTOK_50300 [Mycolicibacterium tokaiense]